MISLATLLAFIAFTMVCASMSAPLTANTTQVDAPAGNPQGAAEIAAILKTHYRRQADDPREIMSDFEELADYYAQFPEVVALIRGLDGHRWQLIYRKNSWATEVTGSRLRVHRGTIRFDLRTGAQLKFRRACDDTGLCSISPADALLHELLHIDSMFNDSSTFLADGGLNGLVYPYIHESRILRAENKLFRSMTAVDGRPRPQRLTHRGQARLVACAVCLLDSGAAGAKRSAGSTPLSSVQATTP